MTKVSRAASQPSSCVTKSATAAATEAAFWREVAVVGGGPQWTPCQCELPFLSTSSSSSCCSSSSSRRSREDFICSRGGGVESSADTLQALTCKSHPAWMRTLRSRWRRDHIKVSCSVSGIEFDALQKKDSGPSDQVDVVVFLMKGDAFRCGVLDRFSGSMR